jgi:hypothetical protein
MADLLAQLLDLALDAFVFIPGGRRHEEDYISSQEMRPPASKLCTATLKYFLNPLSLYGKLNWKADIDMQDLTLSVAEAKKRAGRAWFDDGIWSIVIGVAFLLMGLEHLGPKSGPGAFWGSMLTWTGIFLAIEENISGWIIGWLKARITYPRTGYVAPLHQQSFREPITREAFSRTRTREETVDLFHGFTYFIFFLAFVFHQRWMLVLFVLLYEYFSWHFRNWARLSWYKKYLPPIVGLLWAFLSMPMDLPSETIILSCGLLMLGTGIVHLTLYLKKYPRQT